MSPARHLSLAKLDALCKIKLHKKHFDRVEKWGEYFLQKIL